MITIQPSKLCFTRHAMPRGTILRLSRPLPRVTLVLLLVLGFLVISAPWPTNHFGSPSLEALPRRHRRQLLLLSSPGLTTLTSTSTSASASDARFGSIIASKALQETIFSSQEPSSQRHSSSARGSDTSGAGNSSISPAHTDGALHMRRHVRPDFFEPSVALSDVPRRSNERRRHLHGGSSGSGIGTAAATSGSTATNSDVCVAIATTPRVFPDEQNLPPWSSSVFLLSMLEQRRSPPDSAGGFKDMRVVVYSSGCNGKSPRAATAAGNSSSASSTKEDVAAVQSSPEDLEERTETLATTAHLRALRFAARRSSLDITVLPPRQDACEFVELDAENVRKIGVTDAMASDGWEAWRWRTKLVMDFVYVMRQCMATKPKYILLLQDDTMPAQFYDIGIEKFIDEDLKGKEWPYLSLYNPESYFWEYPHGGEYLVPCCAQALLFNTSAVESLLGFMEERFLEAPMDWLLNQYLIRSNRTGYVHVPSLFQHLGAVRTKAPGVVSSTHEDRQFQDDYVVNLMMGA